MKSTAYRHASTFAIRHNVRHSIQQESAYLTRSHVSPNSPRFQQFADKLEMLTQELESRGESWNGPTSKTNRKERKNNG